jgi:hypothetical protein
MGFFGNFWKGYSRFFRSWLLARNAFPEALLPFPPEEAEPLERHFQAEPGTRKAFKKVKAGMSQLLHSRFRHLGLEKLKL